ncbi:glycosyltransferase, partial [bacterium]|nr:glycosyltransferase [bacterium]
MSKIGVVIPAHNEEKSLQKVIRDIHEVLENYEYNIFVVDDGSEDDT